MAKTRGRRQAGRRGAVRRPRAAGAGDPGEAGTGGRHRDRRRTRRAQVDGVATDRGAGVPRLRRTGLRPRQVPARVLRSPDWRAPPADSSTWSSSVRTSATAWPPTSGRPPISRSSTAIASSTSSRRSGPPRSRCGPGSARAVPRMPRPAARCCSPDWTRADVRARLARRSSRSPRTPVTSPTWRRELDGCPRTRLGECPRGTRSRAERRRCARLRLPNRKSLRR